MFIPRGTVLHENLATSYVLVDGLVTDLCEGGFSGIVEILLRDTDVRIVIACGKVAAAIESHNSETNDSNAIVRSYRRTAVADIALASRRQRGRVSIYNYESAAASAIAECINAETLYTRLSTEFADLEKMISKLSRELDRRWFIEVSTESDVTALVRIKQQGCLVLISQAGLPLRESETSDLASNLALRFLLDECSRAGGVFDVYFKSATDEISFETEEIRQDSIVAQTADFDETNEVSQAVKEAKAMFESLSVETAEPDDYALSDSRSPSAQQPESSSGSDETIEIDTMSASAKTLEKPALPFDLNAFAGSIGLGDEKSNANDEKRMPESVDLLLVQDDLRATGLLKRGSEPDRMAEVKRLMGEITRTIELATQTAESRDGFSLHLRAGQLKIAEQYPFLDPFGSEFEYLAGEIVFVGQASPGEFVAGLTEALKFAIEAAVKSSAQPARLRARLADQMEWLLKQQRAEFGQHGLNQSIEEIISAVRQD